MPPYDEDDLNKPFPKPSAAQRAEQERIHRAWLNGEDTAPGAYDDAMEGPPPDWRSLDGPVISEWGAGDADEDSRVPDPDVAFELLGGVIRPYVTRAGLAARRRARRKQ